MPRVGYTSITVSKDVYNVIQRLMDRENEEAGFKKYRSISHYVEEKIMAEAKGLDQKRRDKK